MKINNKEINVRIDDDKYVFSTLYNTSKNGKTINSNMYVLGNEIFCSKGLENGKETKYKPIKCTGKNKGKTNETTNHQQALIQAQSKYDKKINRNGYTITKKINNNIKVNIQTRNVTEKSDKYVFPMLAKKYTPQKNIIFPCGVSKKLDGCRCLSTKIQDEVILTSRTKKEFNFLNTVRTHLFKLLKKGDILDGELYSHTIPFNKIISIVRLKNKQSINDNIMEYWIFDIPSIADHCYESRMNNLKQIESTYNLLYPNKFEQVLKFVYYELAYNKEDIKKLHDNYVNNGYEGAIIRLLDGVYEFNRSNNLLKYKEFIDEEFTVVNVTDGVGSEERAIIFICETKKGDVFKVRPRGAMSKRRWQYENKHHYIGQQLTVRFQYEGKTYTHDEVPRFGVGINFNPLVTQCEPVEFRNYE